jgi:hypothetical protein
MSAFTRYPSARIGESWRERRRFVSSDYIPAKDELGPAEISKEDNPACI